MRYSKGHRKGTQIQAAKDLISRREAADLEPQEKYWYLCSPKSKAGLVLFSGENHLRAPWILPYHRDTLWPPLGYLPNHRTGHVTARSLRCGSCPQGPYDLCRKQG